MTEKEFLINVKSIDGMICKFCLCSNIPQMDREDLKQEMLMKLWIVKDKYCCKKSKFSTWAYSILSNQLKDLMRCSYRDKRRAMNHYVLLEELQEPLYNDK